MRKRLSNLSVNPSTDTPVRRRQSGRERERARGTENDIGCKVGGICMRVRLTPVAVLVADRMPNVMKP